jgi:hypothetical protein
MMRSLFFSILSVLILSSSAALAQERHISPVTPTTNKILPPEKKKGGFFHSFVTGDTVPSDSALRADSLQRAKRVIYPLMSGITIGVNVFDPILQAFKQSYGGVDFSAEISLWNRLFPTVEIGMGRANSSPEDMNFTYKTSLTPYAKIGANYNFLYSKIPDYKAMFGFRLGYSKFTYDITNITPTAGYWNETGTFDITNQHSHALWGELLFAVRAKIIGNVSMGWSVRYRMMFKCKDNYNSSPWYIPGYGARGSRVYGTFSIFYTLPLSKSHWPKFPPPDNADGSNPPLPPPEKTAK